MTQVQANQQDPGRLARLGGWLFKHRTSLPLPIVTAILLIPSQPVSSPFSVAAGRYGILLVASGELLRLWAVRHIGAISRTRSDRLGKLIDSGPFSLVRNPLYVGNILLWLGFTVSAGLLWLAPVVGLLLALEYHAIIRWEEQLLESRLADAYRRYAQRVPRWIPRVALPVASNARAAFSWRETLYSERGTLIAIAAGYVLLFLKANTSRWA